MFRLRFYILLLFLSGQISISFCQNSDTLFLNDHWVFGEKNKSVQYPAKVPGSVHTDLLSNNLIGDPFFGCNEKDQQWIETKSWIYSATFELNDKFLDHPHVELIAEGLDTYASVYINDQLVISADNMFRLWSADCKPFLHPGKNTIEVAFDSPVVKGKEKASQLKYSLPGDERLLVRKAQYQFGWDWGGRFVGCGIWKPIYLKAWSDVDLADVQFVQHSLNKKEANLSISSLLNSDNAGEAEIKITDMETGTNYGLKKVSLIRGINTVPVDFTIKNPVFWWTHDLGAPHLYHFNVEVYLKGVSIAKRVITAGLRTVEVVNEKDADGESFFFKLNGVTVFMKGANYIPQDNFPARVSSQQYNDLLNIAVKNNMNMLRVWGGGIYENDIFYNLCDAKGILVWQDFMFACAMYPGDTAFLNNANEEVVYQVKRLRNHPCIGLWCGNNEIDEGWNNWGWQQQYHYSLTDSAEIWHNYVTLFQKMIPAALSVYDPNRFYWQSSPEYGWGREKSYSCGDSHYWGVWWGMEPFSIYKKKVGRFASEYGFQGFPDKSTLLKAMEPKELSLGSDALKCHEKHPAGFETIQTYMQREYNPPKNTEDYIYVSQLLQAYGIKTAIEAHRNAKPRCMGTLYWQFNDCWPVISWSSTDYYHHPKALQYFVRKAYSNLLVTLEKKGNSIDVRINSDKTVSISGQVELQLTDFDGNVYWQQKKPVTIAPNGNIIADKIDTLLLLKDKTNISSLVLYASLKVNDKIVSDNYLYFKDPKDLSLQDPLLTWKIDSLPGKVSITLQNKKLAKNVFISFKDSDGTDIRLSDNFFDMLPNSSVQIFAITNEPLQYIKSHIRVKSLFDVQ
jgi:beta-mannosidase